MTACEREMAYQGVKVGAPFEITATIDDWPAWPDPMDEPVLTPVEIRLTDGRTKIWQTTLETAPPQPDSERTRSAMLSFLSNEKPLAWLDYIDVASEAFQQMLARPGSVIGLRGILPDAAYRDARSSQCRRGAASTERMGGDAFAHDWPITRALWLGPRQLTNKWTARNQHPLRPLAALGYRTPRRSSYASSSR